MFNLVTGAMKNDFKHYFSTDSLTGQLLIAAVTIFIALIVANIIIYFVKHEWSRPALLISFLVIFVFAVVALGFAAAAEQTDYAATVDETADWRFDYQMMFTVSTIVAIAVGTAFILAVRKVAGKYFKYIAIGAAAVLGALTITFFVLSGTGLGDGFGMTSEALNEKSSMYLAVTIATAVLMGLVLLTISGGEKSTTTEIVYAAVCIAVSFALSYIRILKLPQGGSITIASLVPIAVYSYKFGVKKGIMCCFIYGLLQALQDPWIVHPLQFFLDYPLAFSAVGLTGLFRNRKFTSKKINIAATALAGFIIALVGRYLCHVIAGTVFFGSYGADYGVDSAVAWGFIYNAFVFADGAIAAAALFLLLANKDVARLVLQPDSRRRLAATSQEAATDTDGAFEPDDATANDGVSPDGTSATANSENS